MEVLQTPTMILCLEDLQDHSEYSTAYPPLATWGDIENIVKQEFVNVLSEYVDGTYNDNTVKKHLDAAADRVNDVLKRER